MPYKNLVITPKNSAPQASVKNSQFYKGFSTVDATTFNTKLYDYDLIKQDIINHFNTRQGERVMNPTFGTIIWNVIYDPLTDQLKQAVVEDVNRILQYDPRVVPVQVNLTETDYGLQLEATLSYVGKDQTDVLRLAFDKEIGLIQQQ